MFCILGTERCNEALQKLERKYDIVVNIQGDEPLLEPEVIDGVVKALQVRFDKKKKNNHSFHTTKKKFTSKTLMIICFKL